MRERYNYLRQQLPVGDFTERFGKAEINPKGLPFSYICISSKNSNKPGRMGVRSQSHTGLSLAEDILVK